MASIERFEDTEVWRDARRLTRMIYECAKADGFRNDFALRNQLRSAAVSVMGNIAEGFERDGTTELIHFLSIAKGSSGEVRSHLCVAMDAGYISTDVHTEMTALACSISRQLSGWMDHLQNLTHRGRKFRKP